MTPDANDSLDYHEMIAALKADGWSVLADVNDSDGSTYTVLQNDHARALVSQSGWWGERVLLESNALFDRWALAPCRWLLPVSLSDFREAVAFLGTEAGAQWAYIFGPGENPHPWRKT